MNNANQAAKPPRHDHKDNDMPRTLSGLLTRTFKAPTPRKPDVHRKARETATALAKQHGIEIERIEGGFNVWPPRGFSSLDPYEGDHFASDWSAILPRVEAYSKG